MHHTHRDTDTDTHRGTTQSTIPSIMFLSLKWLVRQFPDKYVALTLQYEVLCTYQYIPHYIGRGYSGGFDNKSFPHPRAFDIV